MRPSSRCTPLLLFFACYSLASAQTSNDRCAALVTSLRDSKVIRELTSPVFTTPADLDAARTKYSALRDCLKDPQTARLASDPGAAARMAAAFLYFTGATGSHERVDLGTTNDSGIVKLRDQIGVPAPAGATYINYFATTQAVPPEFDYAFSRTETIAATLPCRYVLILGKPPIAGDPIGDFAGGRTRSHELVHSYLCAAAGSERHATFPSWFREGLASYLSESSRISGELDRTGAHLEYRIHQETPDYLGYTTLFRYLEGHFGSALFREFVRRSVETGDAESALSVFGFANSDAAFQAARRWTGLQPFSSLADELRRAAVLTTAACLILLVAIRKRIAAAYRRLRQWTLHLLLYEETAAYFAGWLRGMFLVVLLYLYFYVLTERGIDASALVYLVLGFAGYRGLIALVRAAYEWWHLWPRWPVPLVYRQRSLEYLEKVYEQCARVEQILRSPGPLATAEWLWVFPEACANCGWRERHLSWVAETVLEAKCARCGHTQQPLETPLPPSAHNLAPPRFPMLFTGMREPDGPESAPFDVTVAPDPEWLHPMLWIAATTKRE